ncbi:RNA polymerase sigma factor [Candidatus Latescibacterota bacterium]
MDNIQATDDSSLAATAAGDPRALERLLAQYADPLFAFIHHQMEASRPEVEDVWQEALLAAVQALPRFRGESRMFTWLCGIARRKIADHLRQRGRHVFLHGGSAAAPLLEGIDHRPLPDAALASDEARQAVIAALAGLPADYQRALVALYVDEKPVAAVAALLGRSYKATESLLGRARLALRQALEDRERV